MKITRKLICLTLLAGILFSVATVRAQDGVLDNTFGTSGIVTTSSPFFDLKATHMALQPDGKILVCGDPEDQSNFNPDILLIRYNTDGSLDTTFDNDGIIHTDRGGWEAVRQLVVQNDGKILLVGDVTWVGGAADFALFRYNSNGSIDSTFGIDGAALIDFGGQDYGYSIVQQNDGKIVVSGKSVLGDCKIALARFTSDGNPDNTFGVNGLVVADPTIFNEMIYTLALQDDGKILVAGDVFVPNASQFLMVRFQTDGSIDSTFAVNGVIMLNSLPGGDYGKSISVQADGKIILAGSAIDSNLTQILRYTSNGILDQTYGTNGIVYSTLFETYMSISSCLQNDGKLVIAGAYRDFDGYDDFGLIRLNTDGSTDQSFGINGSQATSLNGYDEPEAINIQPDGKILIAGTTLNTLSEHMQIAVLRYNNPSIAEITESDNLFLPVQIYPNPAISSVTIAFESSLTNATCLIYNESGQVVKEINHVNSSSVTLNRDELAKGVYYVRIADENRLIAEVQKVIFM